MLRTRKKKNEKKKTWVHQKGRGRESCNIREKLSYDRTIN